MAALHHFCLILLRMLSFGGLSWIFFQNDPWPPLALLIIALFLVVLQIHILVLSYTYARAHGSSIHLIVVLGSIVVGIASGMVLGGVATLEDTSMSSEVPQLPIHEYAGRLEAATIWQGQLRTTGPSTGLTDLLGHASEAWCSVQAGLCYIGAEMGTLDWEWSQTINAPRLDVKCGHEEKCQVADCALTKHHVLPVREYLRNAGNRTAAYMSELISLDSQLSDKLETARQKLLTLTSLLNSSSTNYLYLRRVILFYAPVRQNLTPPDSRHPSTRTRHPRTLSYRIAYTTYPIYSLIRTYLPFTTQEEKLETCLHELRTSSKSMWDLIPLMEKIETRQRSLSHLHKPSLSPTHFSKTDMLHHHSTCTTTLAILLTTIEKSIRKASLPEENGDRITWTANYIKLFNQIAQQWVNLEELVGRKEMEKTVFGIGEEEKTVFLEGEVVAADSRGLVARRSLAELSEEWRREGKQ